MAASVRNEHFVNFDALGHALGVIGAMADFNKTDYANRTVRYAFDATDEMFNSAAEALAMATENIDHMYEWNTAKINRGDRRGGKGRSASSDLSRLWRTSLVGSGNNRRIQYTFMPSKIAVPKPRARESGMDSDVIASLSDHVFGAKAFIFETGSTVTVRTQSAKNLLIPYSPYQPYPKNFFSPREKERGYAMRKGPYSFAPGRISNQAGQFTAFWNAFWNTSGKNEMNRIMGNTIQKDFDPNKERFSIAKTRPSRTLQMRREITNSKKKMEKRAVARAKRRGKIR